MSIHRRETVSIGNAPTMSTRGCIHRVGVLKFPIGAELCLIILARWHGMYARACSAILLDTRSYRCAIIAWSLLLFLSVRGHRVSGIPVFGTLPSYGRAIGVVVSQNSLLSERGISTFVIFNPFSNSAYSWSFSCAIASASKLTVFCIASTRERSRLRHFLPR